MRKKINIYNYLELNIILDILDSSESSVSYAGLIFTTQPYIELNKVRHIETIFSEYEKNALKGLVKEKLYKNFDLYNMNKIPDHLITTINCNVFNCKLGFYLSIYKNNELRACLGTNEINNEEFTLLSAIKKNTNELTLYKTKYKNLEFNKIEPSEYNKLLFNITILYPITKISKSNYLGNIFKYGSDGLILETSKEDVRDSRDSRDSKNNKNTHIFSLSSVENDESENILDQNSNSNTNTNDIYKKKQLLESLCQLQNCKLDTMNNIKLYFNEGISF